MTPSGRIISRATKDQDNIDTQIPINLQPLIQMTVMVTISITVSIISTPIVLVFAIILGIIYFLFLKKYLKSSREVMRLELSLRGPLSSHFSESFEGLSVIRAFNKENDFYSKFLSKTIKVNTAMQNYQHTKRWISFRSDIFGGLMITSVAYFIALSKNININNNSSLMGVSLLNILQITQFLPFLIQFLGEIGNFMSSVQRIFEYIEEIPSEKSFDEPKAPENWPNEGKIEAKNVKYRYRPNLDNVIHNINFSISKSEKIGIVGRTGSGKSTLTLGLLRIIELWEDNLNEDEKGKILIDGVDISKIGLHHLRKNITIIPQDPVLFSGSLKSNIDPFNEYSEKQIENALEKTHILEALKSRVAINASLNDVLNQDIDENGGNLSLGQKQLLAMSRALLRNSKILLMDEATASIDEKTDNLIQKMIKEDFKNTTIITIAHRLNTIIHYDRLLVIDMGKIIEFDSPINLMQNENGLFYKMVNVQGKEFAKKMENLAKEASHINFDICA